MARIQWEGQTAHTAHTLLAEPTRDEPGSPAKAFIVDYLTTHGEANAADVLKAGRAAGFSDQELKDARRRSSTQKISSRKASFGDRWVWAIDPHEGGKRREGGNEGGEGGGNQNVPPSPPSGDDSPPSAIPAGAPTDRTPGYTDRVRQILDNAHDKELTT